MTATLLDKDAVAELLGVSARTVDRLPIPSFKIGRCRRWALDDVQTYLQNVRVSA